MPTFLKNLLGQTLARRCIDHPIFVIGTGRSGTSVLLQALGMHPAIISMPGEAPFLTSIGGNAALFKHAESTDYYLSSLSTKLSYLIGKLARLGLECAGGEYYALRAFYQAARTGDPHFWRKRHWCAKTFPSETVAKGLMAVYPGARFLYIVRNGIDVVHSMTKFHGFRDKDFQSHCAAWAESIRKYRYLTDLPNARYLHQEDLLKDPEAFFEHILGFLHLPPDVRCVKFVKSNVVHPLDQPTQRRQDALIQLKNRPSASENWTSEQKHNFISVCGNAMQEAGYDIPF